MKTINYAVIFVYALAILVSCGDKKNKEENKAQKLRIGVQKVAVKEDNNIAEIVISGDDLMRFDQTEIKVKAGQKVKITLRHKGKLGVNIMGHNFVLLKKGVNMADFAGQAAASQNNQYIPKGTEDVIAYTSIIGGGQTTTVEFDSPQTGTYDFLCSFPGHYALMKGKFIVE